ncbi:uncharacterized protein STEHIDRAFT_121834 [Stereum hirsutum FP-91666 SS1]|uniref:uncharacterized protein n=1 Tax=Stereum hirsutum (strain FP-91666) TaxID=721885 RepID=UPI00044492CD|nr:uncharacterized protein STEHIDRAFT_121834 [Stereum hirsutum FP-91666 SS1]EIM85816.1 hypothetical protein STEHIDRAFT_121834 [Stereum hirsutum FP-91666 SS1]
MSYTVNVTGISPSTTETQLHDFFTFCGKITSIDFEDAGSDGKKANIHFEKPSAAKTALMLNSGTLEGSQLTVTSDVVHQDEETDAAHVEGVPTQEDKPRAGIAAEYLARGYTLSDGILTKAISIDNEKGISKRFLSYINSIDQTVGAKALGPDQTVSGKVLSTLQSTTQQARSMDEQKGYSKTATDYYSKALSSPFGQRVRDFYTKSSKQVFDIHEEAKRLAAEHKATQPAAAPGSASAEIPGAAAPTAEKAPAPTVA